jgi:glutamate carboxypeptidase
VVTRPDGALNGPGLADMKGGISIMLAALAAVQSHPAAARLGARVLLSPDEEIGSLASAPRLAEVARGGHVGLTYEPAQGGALASSRKGSGNFSVVVRGRAAHAGRDFASGRNAIVAAAAIAGRLDALNGRREGVTLNVAKIEGGSPSNMVPDTAVIRFNVRLPTPADAAWIEDAVAASLATPDGVTAHLHGGFTRPPKPVNAAQEQLFGAARQCAGLIGVDLRWTPSGGVCEGNNLFAAGLPNLDTLGVRGGDIHSEAEHAWPDSFVERAQLSALILCKLATGEIDGPGVRAAMGR